MFSYVGVDIFAATAAESRSLADSESIKMAARKINLRIITLYSLAVLMASFVVPYDHPFINGGETSVSARSVFIIAVVQAGLPAAAHFFNAVFVFSTFSCAINSMYVASRVLHTLALRRQTGPEFITRRLRACRSGVPGKSVLATASLMMLGYMGRSGAPGTVSGVWSSILKCRSHRQTHHRRHPGRDNKLDRLTLLTAANWTLKQLHRVVLDRLRHHLRHLPFLLQDVSSHTSHAETIHVGLTVPNRLQSAKLYGNVSEAQAASYDRSNSLYPYKSHGQWLKASYGMVASIILVLFNGVPAFLENPFNVPNFVSAYISASCPSPGASRECWRLTDTAPRVFPSHPGLQDPKTRLPLLRVGPREIRGLEQHGAGGKREAKRQARGPRGRIYKGELGGLFPLDLGVDEIGAVVKSIWCQESRQESMQMGIGNGPGLKDVV